MDQIVVKGTFFLHHPTKISWENISAADLCEATVFHKTLKTDGEIF
jgi:hypothetical protein